MRVPYISLLAAGALALGGCAYDYYGYGYGPYSGLSLGVGYGGGYYGGYGGYGGGYYGGYGGYYSSWSPFGWYDDFYYPGSGIYVYDSYRRPRVWSSSQRSYWTSRRSQWEHHSGKTWSGSNWDGYTHRRHR